MGRLSFSIFFLIFVSHAYLALGNDRSSIETNSQCNWERLHISDSVDDLYLKLQSIHDPFVCSNGKISLDQVQAQDPKDRALLQHLITFVEPPRCVSKEGVIHLFKFSKALVARNWETTPNEIYSIFNTIETQQETWRKIARDEQRHLSFDIKELMPNSILPNRVAQVLVNPDGNLIILYKNQFIGKGGMKTAYLTLEVKANEGLQNVSSKVIAYKSSDKTIREVFANEGFKNLEQVKKWSDSIARKIDSDPNSDRSILEKQVKDQLLVLDIQGDRQRLTTYIVESILAHRLSEDKVTEREVQVYEILNKHSQFFKSNNNNIRGIANAERVQLSDKKTGLIQERYVGDLIHHYEKNPNGQLEQFIEMAEGLSFIHSAGIVHSDLKPANVYRDSNKGLHIADFGVSFNPFKEGIYGRTPGYSAPEVVEMLRNRHRRAKTQTDRERYQKIDVYSLGVMMLESMGYVLDANATSEASHNNTLQWAKEAAQSCGGQPCLATLAYAAVQTDPDRRPTSAEMFQILTQLKNGNGFHFDKAFFGVSNSVTKSQAQKVSETVEKTKLFNEETQIFLQPGSDSKSEDFSRKRDRDDESSLVKKPGQKKRRIKKL